MSNENYNDIDAMIDAVTEAQDNARKEEAKRAVERSLENLRHIQEMQKRTEESRPIYTDYGVPPIDYVNNTQNNKKGKVIDFRKSVGKGVTSHSKVKNRRMNKADKLLIGAIVAGCLTVSLFLITSPTKNDQYEKYLDQILENKEATIEQCIKILQQQALTELRYHGMADITIDNDITISVNNNSVEDYQKLNVDSATTLKIFESVLPKDEYKKLRQSTYISDEMSNEDFREQIYQNATAIKDQYAINRNSYTMSYSTEKSETIDRLSDKERKETIIDVCTEILQKQMLDKLLQNGLADVVSKENLFGERTFTIKIENSINDYASKEVIEDNLDAYIFSLLAPTEIEKASGKIGGYSWLISTYQNDDGIPPGELFEEEIKKQIYSMSSSILSDNATNTQTDNYLYTLSYDYFDETAEVSRMTGRAK